MDTLKNLAMKLDIFILTMTQLNGTYKDIILPLSSNALCKIEPISIGRDDFFEKFLSTYFNL